MMPQGWMQEWTRQLSSTAWEMALLMLLMFTAQVAIVSVAVVLVYRAIHRIRHPEPRYQPQGQSHDTPPAGPERGLREVTRRLDPDERYKPR